MVSDGHDALEGLFQPRRFCRPHGPAVRWSGVPPHLWSYARPTTVNSGLVRRIFCSAINSIVYLKAFEAIRAQYHLETLGLCVRAQEYTQFRHGSRRSKSQMPAHNTKRRLLREPETTGKMMMLPWLLEGFPSTPDVKYIY